MRDFIVMLNETPWSIALRESLYVWPILEATHVLTIMLFAGTILMVDLRLLGLTFKQTTVSEMTERVLPWTVAGFILLVITGSVLFYAKPLVYYHNIFFRLKMLFLVAAFANILYFHKRAQANVAEWDLTAPPRSARISAGLSLAAWTAIIVAGRMIAYDWYDCGKLRPGGFLAVAASCPAPLAQSSEE